jgi:hypothetical protein
MFHLKYFYTTVTATGLAVVPAVVAACLFFQKKYAKTTIAPTANKIIMFLLIVFILIVSKKLALL